VWSGALPKVKDHVSQSLIGSWVSVVGLVEPPYVSRKYHYSHISIDITGPNQIKVIPPAEAMYRLGAIAGGSRNRDVIDTIHGRATTTRRGTSVSGSAPPPRSGSALILQQMQRAQGAQSHSPPGQQTSARTASSGWAKKGSRIIPWWVWPSGILILLWLLNK
jgi:hypothetical protein